MLGASSRSSEQSGLAFVFEPVSFAIDADDGGVVQDRIVHRGGELAGDGKFEGDGRDQVLSGELHPLSFTVITHLIKVIYN
jgi:hypothetical protein